MATNILASYIKDKLHLYFNEIYFGLLSFIATNLDKQFIAKKFR